MRGQVELDRPLPRQDATKQEFEHWDVAGFGYFDRLAHELLCLADRSAVLGAWFSPGIAVGEWAAASSRDVDYFWVA
jgi:hypothetical protein